MRQVVGTASNGSTIQYTIPTSDILFYFYSSRASIPFSESDSVVFNDDFSGYEALNFKYI